MRVRGNPGWCREKCLEEAEGQESCRRLSRVKLRYERDAPKREQYFRVDRTLRWQPVSSQDGTRGPHQGVRESGKAAVDRDTGMSTRCGKEAMGKRQRRRSQESDKDVRSFWGYTLKTMTLGVLTGWNKPVSHAGRKTCCEVAKTCE